MSKKIKIKLHSIGLPDSTSFKKFVKDSNSILKEDIKKLSNKKLTPNSEKKLKQKLRMKKFFQSL